MNKTLGPTFAIEISAADLSGIPFWWDADFNVNFNDDVTQEQRDAVLAVIDAHDPTRRVVPSSVTRYQARVALANSGLLEQVNAYFDALPDSDTGKMAWLEAPTVERHSPALIAAAHALGLTDEQIDQLFITGADLQ